MNEITTWPNKSLFEQEYGKLDLDQYIGPVELPEWNDEQNRGNKVKPQKCTECIFASICAKYGYKKTRYDFCPEIEDSVYGI